MSCEKISRFQMINYTCIAKCVGGGRGESKQAPFLFWEFKESCSFLFSTLHSYRAARECPSFFSLPCTFELAAGWFDSIAKTRFVLWVFLFTRLQLTDFWHNHVKSNEPDWLNVPTKALSSVAVWLRSWLPNHMTGTGICYCGKGQTKSLWVELK